MVHSASEGVCRLGGNVQIPESGTKAHLPVLGTASSLLCSSHALSSLFSGATQAAFSPTPGPACLHSPAGAGNPQLLLLHPATPPAPAELRMSPPCGKHTLPPSLGQLGREVTALEVASAPHPAHHSTPNCSPGRAAAVLCPIPAPVQAPAIWGPCYRSLWGSLMEGRPRASLSLVVPMDPPHWALPKFLINLKLYLQTLPSRQCQPPPTTLMDPPPGWQQ